MTFKRVDIFSSLIIGEAAALLMIIISGNIALPPAATRYIRFLPYAFPVFTLAVMVVGSLLGRVMPFFYQLAKFGLVGGLNFLVDLGVLNFLIAVTGTATGFEANVFKALAFLTATISSFLWNKFWTFHALSVDDAGKQFIQFLIISVAGFFINVGTFAIVNSYIGPQGGIDVKTWASVSAGGAAIVGLAWNFIGYKFFVFNTK